jgi:hypothetical protein
VARGRMRREPARGRLMGYPSTSGGEAGFLSDNGRRRRGRGWRPWRVLRPIPDSCSAANRCQQLLQEPPLCLHYRIKHDECGPGPIPFALFEVGAGLSHRACHMGKAEHLDADQSPRSKGAAPQGNLSGRSKVHQQQAAVGKQFLGHGERGPHHAPAEREHPRPAQAGENVLDKLKAPFPDRAGAGEVVEADHPAFAGMLHLFSEDQLKRRNPRAEPS